MLKDIATIVYEREEAERLIAIMANLPMASLSKEEGEANTVEVSQAVVETIEKSKKSQSSRL